METTFDPAILEALRAAEEVEIETTAVEGVATHHTIIWVMVDERDRVFIRSVRGAEGRWYREALRRPASVLLLDEARIPVDLVPATDAEQVAACSRALRAKYASDPSLASMLREEVLPTTLRLLPR